MIRTTEALATGISESRNNSGMNSAEEYEEALFMERVASKLWYTSEMEDMAYINDFISSVEGVNGYNDVNDQEWTIEDMDETNETMKVLEDIVKAQFRLSDEVEPTSFCISDVSVPDSYNRQHELRENIYEPYEGKGSIFDDSSSGRPRKPLFTRSTSDGMYPGHDNRPPRSPANRGIDSDIVEFNKTRYKGKGITDPHLSDAAERASSKLRKFQSKIIRTIELSPEVNYTTN